MHICMHVYACMFVYACNVLVYPEVMDESDVYGYGLTCQFLHVSSLHVSAQCE